MKLFFKQIIFFSLALLLFFGTNCCFHQLPKDTNRDFAHFHRHYIELSENNVEADVIIIGASIGAHSMRPSYLDCKDYSFFNFSLNGLNSSFYLNWYDTIFSKTYSKPKYCIFQVDGSVLLESDGDLSQNYLYMPIKLLFSSGLVWQIDYKTFKDLVFTRLKDIVELNLLSIYKRTLSLFDESTEKNDLKFNAETYKFRIERHYEFFEKGYDRGFIPFITKEKNLSERPKSFFLDREKTGVRNTKDFETLIKKFQTDGIEVIFVLPPEYGSNKEYFELAFSTKFLRDFSEKNNIPYLNYNIENRVEEISQCPEYFSDYVHLSPVGSRVFSEVLKNDLCPLLKK